MHSQSPKKTSPSSGSHESAAEIPDNKTMLIAIYNMKGGVGKTTSCLEIAYHLVRDGFRVLLVDADMQANLTTNTIMAANIVDKGLAKAGAEDEDDDLVVDEATDRLWAQINREESTGKKLTFFSIVNEFTGSRLQVRKAGESSLLNKIKPQTAVVGPGKQIDYIAGDMRTGDLEQKILDGFRDPTRYPVPGMVTNIFREYGEQNHYDFVIFDLGCTFTATVKAVLLGSDYVISPFKCERACMTAAEITIKKLRDAHRKWNPVKGAASQKNEDCALTVKEACEAEDAPEDEVSAVLRCYPRFLGAFPVGVKVMSGQPTKAYRRRIDEIFARYNEDLSGFHHVDLKKPDLKELQGLFIKLSESAGREAEGGGAIISTTTVPCVSLCYDRLSRTMEEKNRYKVSGFMGIAYTISQQYKAVIRALVKNMTPEDQAYIESKSSRLFHDAPEEEMVVVSEGLSIPADKKRRREHDDFIPLDKKMHPALASIFSPRTLRSGRMPAIPGYTVEDVKGDGNCFYHAAAMQLERSYHPHMAAIPEGTAPHDSLRLLVQENDFRDGEWVDHAEILGLAEKLGIAIGVMDTRDPSHELVYHFINPSTGMGDSTNEPISLPKDMMTITLLYTGNHYMVLTKDPVPAEAPEADIFAFEPDA